MHRTHVRRAALTLTVSVFGLFALALPALAHVTVSPDSTAKGASDLEVMFRVPNEETKAATTKVEITFPADHPIASVLAQPEPGWTAQVENTTLAKPIHTDDGDISQVVSKITWAGGQIAPGQYVGFHAILGKLPDDADHLVFKADQTRATVGASGKSTSAGDSTARALGIAGLVVGVLGLVAGGYGLMVGRRRGSESASR